METATEREPTEITETEIEKNEFSEKKLENCEVCNAEKAKYTCPKCEVRTCSLPCANLHKKELECDGVRDKTKYIPIKKFSDIDLLSDYRFLEDLGRSVEQFHKNLHGNQYHIPKFLRALKNCAFQKKIDLLILPKDFTRRKENTTYLDYKTKELFWRLEFIFPQAENIKWTLSRVPDTKRLSIILEELLNPEISKNQTDEESLRLENLKKKLKYYQASGVSGLRAFLKAEHVNRSSSRFFDLDLTQSLKENLEYKTIIEFPTIYVVLKDHAGMFEIIDSDDEEYIELKKKRKEILERALNQETKKKKVSIKKEIKEEENKDDYTPAQPVHNFFEIDDSEVH